MSPAEIRELKALERVATPRPWSGPPGYIHIRSVPRMQEYNAREAAIPDDAPEEAYEVLPEIDVAYVPRRGKHGDIASQQGNMDGALIVSAVNALPRLLEERERLLEALRGLLAWAESPATKAVESCAWVHGVKYTAEDVAAWDTARTQRAFAEAPAK